MYRPCLLWYIVLSVPETRVKIQNTHPYIKKDQVKDSLYGKILGTINKIFT